MRVKLHDDQFIICVSTKELSDAFETPEKLKKFQDDIFDLIDNEVTSQIVENLKILVRGIENE